MAISEFDIISRYFNQPGLAASSNQVNPNNHSAVSKSIGDDCALLKLPENQELALSMDVLVADVHFPADADAFLIGQRALCVNLSDLAAMGASPVAFTLGLSLPEVNEKWLAEFARGLQNVACEYACPLIGGDITKGPLNIAIQVHGSVTTGTALLRSGAKPGDKIYVSGELGRAGLALVLMNENLHGLEPIQKDELLTAYYKPSPKVELGNLLRGLASAAIDVSDGVLADAAHIARQSNVCMQIVADLVPVSGIVSSVLAEQAALELALTAGDEYELLFTCAPDHEQELAALAADLKVALTCIGECCESNSNGELVSCVDSSGEAFNFDNQGYRHF